LKNRLIKGIAIFGSEPQSTKENESKLLEAFGIWSWRQMENISWTDKVTRSSADADNRLDAFSGQSRSTNMVPFKKFHDLEMGVKGHSRSLRVVSFDRLCMLSY